MQTVSSIVCFNAAHTAFPVICSRDVQKSDKLGSHRGDETHVFYTLSPERELEAVVNCALKSAARGVVHRLLQRRTHCVGYRVLERGAEPSGSCFSAIMRCAVVRVFSAQ